MDNPAPDRVFDELDDDIAEPAFVPSSPFAIIAPTTKTSWDEEEGARDTQGRLLDWQRKPFLDRGPKQVKQEQSGDFHLNSQGSRFPDVESTSSIDTAMVPTEIVFDQEMKEEMEATAEREAGRNWQMDWSMQGSELVKECGYDCQALSWGDCPNCQDDRKSQQKVTPKGIETIDGAPYGNCRDPWRAQNFGNWASNSSLQAEAAREYLESSDQETDAVMSVKIVPNNVLALEMLETKVDC